MKKVKSKKSKDIKDNSEIGERERFQELLTKSKRYGTVFVDKSEVEKLLTETKGLDSINHLNAKFNSYFQPWIKMPPEYEGDVYSEVIYGKKANENQNIEITPYDVSHRLPMVKECREKLGYDTKRIREIVEYDNAMIKILLKTPLGGINGMTVFWLDDFSDPLITAFRKCCEWSFCAAELVAKEPAGSYLRWRVYPYWLRLEKFRYNSNELDLIKYLSTFDQKKASKDEKDFVCVACFIAWWHLGYDKISSILESRTLVHHGYSPQVVIRLSYQKALSFEEVDWEASLKNVKAGKLLSFFRTPDFELERVKNRIDLHIYHPKNIDSELWRKIGLVYTAFRNRLGVKKRGWGEVSGIKERIDERDTKLRKKYKRLRHSSPSAEIAFDRLLELMPSIWGKPLSLERTKRVVYRKT